MADNDDAPALGYETPAIRCSECHRVVSLKGHVSLTDGEAWLSCEACGSRDRLFTGEQRK